MFPNAPSILPYLELPETGPTSQFCAELSKRLRCYVAAGYPEALGTHEPRSVIVKENYEHEEVGANSAILYSPDGSFVGNYRKTNPFETDMTWAKPGQVLLYDYFWRSHLLILQVLGSQRTSYRIQSTGWRWAFAWT
jgi:protein N-terminal amidase